jgi:hypothetical protein
MSLWNLVQDGNICTCKGNCNQNLQPPDHTIDTNASNTMLGTPSKFPHLSSKSTNKREFTAHNSQKGVDY